MSVVWVSSDWHIGHRNIAKFRNQVTSTEDNTQILLDNTLECVRKRDTLWLLGDMCFTEDDVEVFRVLSKHVENLHLVLGNHDTDTAERRRALRTMLDEGIYTSVHSLVNYNGFWLSHAPLHDLELRGRNIHGHNHNVIIPDDRYVNVCVDVTDMKPVKFQEIKGRFIT